MKKTYQKPVVDKIEFCYRDQVVAASGGTGEYTCIGHWSKSSPDDNCEYTGGQRYNA